MLIVTKVPTKASGKKIDDIKVNPTMKICVSVKNLNDLQVTALQIISENSIVDYITLGVAGGGSMDVDKGNTIKAELSGSGVMTVRFANPWMIVVVRNGRLNCWRPQS
jgi:hypothetical protein